MVGRILTNVLNDVFELGSEVGETNEDEAVEVRAGKGNLRETWVCPICSTQVRYRQNIARHQSLNCTAVKIPKVKPVAGPRPSEYRCELCDFCYAGKSSLTAHMKRMHIDYYCQKNQLSLVECTICDFKCTAQRFLKGHIQRYHSEKGVIKCDYCDKQFATKDTLKVHVKRIHVAVDQTFVCHVCGDVLMCRADYQKHTCEVILDKDEVNQLCVSNGASHPESIEDPSNEMFQCVSMPECGAAVHLGDGASIHGRLGAPQAVPQYRYGTPTLTGDGAPTIRKYPSSAPRESYSYPNTVVQYVQFCETSSFLPNQNLPYVTTVPYSGNAAQNQVNSPAIAPLSYQSSSITDNSPLLELVNTSTNPAHGTLSTFNLMSQQTSLLDRSVSTNLSIPVGRWSQDSMEGCAGDTVRVIDIFDDDGKGKVN